MGGSAVLVALLLYAVNVLPVLSVKSVLICPHLTGEPTIAQLLATLVGNDTLSSFSDTVGIQSKQPADSLAGTVASKILNWNLPFRSLFSDGRFTVSYIKPHSPFTFNDIHVVHKRNIVLDLVCGNGFVNEKLGFLCDCGGGQLAVDPRLGTHCVRSGVCSDKTVSDGKCHIPWNPFHSACVMINVRSDLNEVAEQQVRDSVSYSLVTPVVHDLWTAIVGTSNPFSTAPAPLNSLAGPFDSYFVPVMSNIPIYAVNLLLGYAVVTNSRDLAEHGGVQLLLQVLYGLSLAFLVLAYLLYRMSKRVVGRYGGPLAELAHIPVSFSILSMTLANPTIMRTLQRAVLAFWHTGYPLGVSWAGKAYFLGCVLVCIGVCRYFALFQADSASWHAMLYSLKLAGLALLFNSTSCLPLAVALVLLGSFEDHLRHWAWLFYLTSNAIATKPTYKYLAQKRMTMKEAEALSKSYTQKALAGLRDHLQEHPAQLERVMDRLREGGKKGEAQLVGRFADGKYPGVPYTVSEGDDEVEKRRGGAWFGAWWTALGWMLVMGALAVAAGVWLSSSGREE